MTNLKNEVYTEVGPGPAEKQFPILEHSPTEIPDPTRHETVHRMGTVLSGSPFNPPISNIHSLDEPAPAHSYQDRQNALH